MWFLLPLHVKNYPERMPYVTYALIAINILVFAFTIDLQPGDGYLRISDNVVHSFAVSHIEMNPFRLFTAMFLHQNFLHIAGNMWFLWLFGPSVEGRLRPMKFTALYLLSGIIGGVLEDVVEGFINPEMYGLGASGAIMGLAGAYLYTFPYAPFRVFWAYWLGLIPRLGVSDWHARWVVVYFVGLDLVEGMISKAMAGFGMGGGVAHFAHLGGAATGFLFMAIARVKPDSDDVAVARAMQSDLRGDFDYLSWVELEALMSHPTEDMRVVLAYCDKALSSPGGLGERKCIAAIQHYAAPLAAASDPHRLAAVLLRLSVPNAQALPTVYFLRLGSTLEQRRDFDMAVRVFRRVWETNPRHPDSEIALVRIGRIMERVYRNADQARYYYSELIRAFPSGPNADEARRSLSIMPYTDSSFR